MWLYIPLATLLLQVAPLSQSHLSATSPSPVPKTNEMRTDAAGYAVLRFLAFWRTAWLDGGDWQSHGRTDIRLRDVHCHFDGSYGNTGIRGNFRPPSLAGRGRTIRRNSRPGPSMSPQRACPQVSAAALARCY